MPHKTLDQRYHHVCVGTLPSIKSACQRLDTARHAVFQELDRESDVEGIRHAVADFNSNVDTMIDIAEHYREGANQAIDETSDIIDSVEALLAFLPHVLIDMEGQRTPQQNLWITDSDPWMHESLAGKYETMVFKNVIAVVFAEKGDQTLFRIKYGV